MNRLVSCALIAIAGTSAAVASGPAHSPILIQSDQDFSNCACVKAGDGSSGHPFVIGPWTINNVPGNAVFVDGMTLTKSFVLYNFTIAGNSTATSRGILLRNINHQGIQQIVAGVQGVQTSIQTAGIGIQVIDSHYVTLDGGGSNPGGPGISNKGAGTINKHLIGAIDIENSSNVTVTGWQMSASGPSIQPDWVTLDPSVSIWSVGGVRFFGVSSSVIDHNAMNNTSNNSVSLFYSGHNTVTNNTADYPFTMNFLVADGSSYNLLSGNVAGTGDYFGYMVADPLPDTNTFTQYGASHDNALLNNISHTDGPTGAEISAGVVPAFLGGFVILNGTYNNSIRNNQDWASTGSGFAWAQVVRSALTPIGVTNYPPVLHCNVTVSDSKSVSLAGRNGNIWSGNVTQTIDPCIPAQ